MITTAPFRVWIKVAAQYTVIEFPSVKFEEEKQNFHIQQVRILTYAEVTEQSF